MSLVQNQKELLLKPRMNYGIPEITAEEFKPFIGKVRLIDVRTPEEFYDAHIPGAELVPLGPEIFQLLGNGDRNQEIVFVCRSGNRSGQATQLAIQWGYKYVMNLEGGMIDWSQLRYPVEGVR